MTTLTDIEERAKEFAIARDTLAQRVDALQQEIEQAKRRKLKGIKNAVVLARVAELALRNSINDAPELFEKPRTMILHGIKVGYQKGKGGVEYSDDDQVIKLIRKYLPDQADILIATKENIVKKSLGQLSVAELKKIGVNVKKAGDQVLIKSTDSNVDKLVNALLAEVEQEDENEATA